MDRAFALLALGWVSLIAFGAAFDFNHAIPAGVIAFLFVTLLLAIPLAWAASILAVSLAAAISIFAYGTIPPRGETAVHPNKLGWLSRVRIGVSYSLATIIHTESTPAGGPWSTYQAMTHVGVEMPFSDGLVHSCYEHPAVRAALVRWLRKDIAMRNPETFPAHWDG